jgi:hypothetical protein
MSQSPNFDTVNFNIPSELLDKWTSTRKAPRRLGSNLTHPRIFSTVDYSIDRNWFIFAMIIELSTILIAIFFTGFNFIYITITCIIVAIDVICAIFLHKPQAQINKLRCKYELNNYEGINGIIDEKLCNGKRKGFEEEEKKLSRKKLIFVIIILLIAIIKSLGVIIALAGESFMVLYIVPVLFFLTAYVHIRHSGYFLAERTFRKELVKEEKIFFREQALAESQTKIENLISVESLNEIEHLPDALKNELNNIIAKMPSEEKLQRKYDNKRNLDTTSQNILVFINKNNDNIRLLYDEKNDNYKLSSWGEVLDNNLFALIDGGGVTEDLKSFIGYYGLKLQSQKFSIKK